jgi:ribonuclease E
MLIDASHAEETRVVVLDGTRLEDFDVETVSRKQIKGNIYLAKVIRVEPSLQAAFVEYGGNRHGFLAFGEIHPDYYQIPVADRQKLLAMQAEAEEEARAEEEATHADDARESFYQAESRGEAGEAPAAYSITVEYDIAEPDPAGEGEALASQPEPQAQPLDIRPIEIVAAPPPAEDEIVPEGEVLDEPPGIEEALSQAEPEDIAPDAEAGLDLPEAEAQTEAPEAVHEDHHHEAPEDHNGGFHEDNGFTPANGNVETVVETAAAQNIEIIESEADDQPAPEQIGGDGDDAAEARERRLRQRFLRNYKIQDVIHRRQIMLVQVVKEERGNKGAALTTYLSLAGRFSVLMPNSPTGGGVSRKITSQADRRRLKEAMQELDVPQGMGLIVRTAGANRPKPEIKRDCEYLLRLWDDIRDKTLDASAPAQIYEEASLIKRAIRDVYTRDVEEILVDGEEGYKAARDFMRMLMPANAKRVRAWTDGQPLFAKYQVEAQLDAMLNPVVQLRSGGYIVINQTEALVAIDVNSGRSTRERSIEDTALRTNMEAAEEVAKQLRMRDLAGLIVIDFIDMESRKNNASVERRLKESLKHDRARIQVGGISHFGLLEMSRQRLRPSLTEASLVLCPHCAGMGHVRSAESAALYILRAIEDEGAKLRSAEISVSLPPEIAFYLFNHKRERLSAIEMRYSMRVLFIPDTTLTGTNFKIEKLRAQITMPAIAAAPVTPERVLETVPEIEDEDDSGETETEVPGETAAETAERAERKRRRRRRGKRRGENGAPETSETTAEEPAEASEDEEEHPSEIDLVLEAALGVNEEETGEPPAEEAEQKRRRRSRGGRRRRGPADAAAGTEQPYPAESEQPVVTPPVFTDIADIFEAAERAEEEARAARVRAREAAETEAEMVEIAAPELAPMVEPVVETTAPEPVAPEAAASEPETAPEPEAPAAPESAVKPIIVGAGDTAASKKTGWWRR